MKYDTAPLNNAMPYLTFTTRTSPFWEHPVISVSQLNNLVMLCKFVCVYGLFEESISKEMDNDKLAHPVLQISASSRTAKDILYCLITTSITKTRMRKWILKHGMSKIWNTRSGNF